MHAKQDQDHRRLEAAALSLCVTAAMLAGCKATDAPGLSAASLEIYGAGTAHAAETHLLRLAWPRMLLDSR